jgi:hypothetical protein
MYIGHAFYSAVLLMDVGEIDEHSGLCTAYFRIFA